ncbi:MAG: hypothetical protein H0T62_11155 [Parachlamydiaceae bacterium]|nr:hypothetical protein [Parachlamydiaceae bacterium]
MNIEPKNPLQINKATYSNKDQRQNLDAFESSELLDESFINTVKKQAESVACFVSNDFLKKRVEGGWELASKTPTLAQVVENEKFRMC